MKRIVFLLEERSMRVLLEGMLPRVFPGLEFLCIPHEGKQDLEKSVPRKLRAWREPGVRFVVVRDNDAADCVMVKNRLLGLCDKGSRPDTLVRIACQELEAWYFGEPGAIATGFGRPELRNLDERATYRDADSIVNPSAELKRLVPEFQKISGGRLMASRLSPENNRSSSFLNFVLGVDRIFKEMTMNEPETDAPPSEGGP